MPNVAGDNTVRAALGELGSPALLAEQYRQNTRDYYNNRSAKAKDLPPDLHRPQALLAA